MQGNRRANTQPELNLRRRLHAAGLRYRKDHPVKTTARTVRPDLVFAKPKIAVFVDGCFWHGCPEHCRMPAANKEYWDAKIARNERRDRAVDQELEAVGWTVIRIWEHVDPNEAAAYVASAVRLRTSHLSLRPPR
jgi:DNA mismatch endonuclease (patch repair protein)